MLSPCPPADLTPREAVLSPTPSSPEQFSRGTQLDLSTCLPMTQTCGEVLPWPEFDQASHEVLEAFNNLDNGRRNYGRPECSGILGRRVQRAETQDEVMMHLSEFMDGVNDTAEELSIPVHCCDGFRRCTSHAEVIMRPAGAHSNPAWLSEHILGVVLVTCDLQLHRGERLEDALRDSLRNEGIRALLQQVIPRAHLARVPVMMYYHSGVPSQGHTSFAYVQEPQLTLQGKGFMSRLFLWKHSCFSNSYSLLAILSWHSS